VRVVDALIFFLIQTPRCSYAVSAKSLPFYQAFFPLIIPIIQFTKIYKFAFVDRHGGRNVVVQQPLVIGSVVSTACVNAVHALN